MGMDRDMGRGLGQGKGCRQGQACGQGSQRDVLVAGTVSQAPPHTHSGSDTPSPHATASCSGRATKTVSHSCTQTCSLTQVSAVGSGRADAWFYSGGAVVEWEITWGVERKGRGMPSVHCGCLHFMRHAAALCLAPGRYPKGLEPASILGSLCAAHPDSLQRVQRLLCFFCKSLYSPLQPFAPLLLQFSASLHRSFFYWMERFSCAVQFG